MSAPRRIVIGARRSALAVIQARAVGDALGKADPGLRIDYVFSAARGDLSDTADVEGIVRRGGFTEDLGLQLDAGAIDLAVHSWKDLPLAQRPGTRVLGTLQRADLRDLLLIRKEALAAIRDSGSLRVLSCSERRRVNLRDFIAWALPMRIERSEFLPVRGAIEARVAQLLAGAGDALMIAKAAIDRMLADGVQSPARQTILRALRDCVVIVVPLAACPPAAGQGALAVEARSDRADLAALLAGVNHDDSFETVQRELELARAYGADDAAIGISVLRFAYGDVEILRGVRNGALIASTRLDRRGAGLPKPAGPNALWIGDDESADAIARVPLPERDATPTRGRGLIVARADALPRAARHDPEQSVWTAGLETWRKLAAAGVWVHGSDESLGETRASAAAQLFPHVTEWVKYTHDEGFETASDLNVATYRLERRVPLADVHGRTHFFWRSASQCLAYLRAYPGLARAWHGCGPGNSLRMLAATLTSERLRPFLSAAQFREELAS